MLLALLVACDEPDAAHTGAPADTDAADDTDVADSADWPDASPACGLATDLATSNFLEGDTVSFSVSCTGELATEDAAITAVVLPNGATFDGAAFEWATGPADGGRIDVVFAVTPRADPAATPVAETVTFWVADDASAADNVPVDPATYTEEWGLPVIHLDVGVAIPEEYVDATVVSYGVSYPATIKVRGASSAYYPKPSYMLEFDEDELPVDAWGVTRDHLILLSTFDDNSYVRQKLVYDLWAGIADYWGEPRLTPRTYFTVVYLDGAYAGLYVGLDRVDDEFMDQMGFDREGALFKAVNHNANFSLYDVYGAPKATMHDGYTKEEGDPDDFTELDDFVTFTGNADYATIVAEADGWIDLTEFMDWFLLVYYANGEDSAGKNAYLTASRTDARLRYAPWDFNHSWGQGWYTYRIGSDYLDDYSWTNRVFTAILSTPSAQETLWARYASMRQDGPFAPDWLDQTVDDYYALIEPSAARDWAKWGSAYRSYGGWASSRDAYGDWTDYEGEKVYLRRWMDERAAVFED